MKRGMKHDHSINPQRFFGLQGGGLFACQLARGVCVHRETMERDDGWRALRVQGTLDFALVGILAGIAQVLAQHKIPIFAISTYNTDYILLKQAHYPRALSALANAGYTMEA